VYLPALPLQYKDNLEARMKYSDAPEKFLDSEVDLDEQIKSLLQVGDKGL
jgi:beta-catenin-like protein 1